MTNRIITKLVSLPKLATFNASKKLAQRVAAYARVSTDHEEQAASLVAQTDYYRKKIQQHPGWAFVGIYVDSGVSGLSTNRREGFNRMVEDYLAGRIDLVLTKSISRFARNTVDTVTTIRKLKEKGISVYFEKKNIFSTDAKGDVLRSDLIQCNDGVRAVRPLDIWVLARRLSFGSRFFFSEIGDGGVVGCILY